ncbi:hypothetical protein Agub_g15633, partial [Astrephomene gubernaculifera]
EAAHYSDNNNNSYGYDGSGQLQALVHSASCGDAAASFLQQLLLPVSASTGSAELQYSGKLPRMASPTAAAALFGCLPGITTAAGVGGGGGVGGVGVALPICGASAWDLDLGCGAGAGAVVVVG